MKIKLDKSVRQTIEEVLEATKIHFDAICGEDTPRLQDVVDGMDISILKLSYILESTVAEVTVGS